MKRRLVLLVVAAAACGPRFLDLPGTPSPLPTPNPEPGFRAGFGRVDITPPPGVGLAGNGPEGNQSTGHRLRLYARVMVLEDERGNRLGLVVTDLPLGSALLHRAVAESTVVSSGIGPDRLVISATHTHSGPGHYLDATVYNSQGAAVEGYDEVFVDSLARRISRTIEQVAKAELRPARVAWGSRLIWGLTRIRSLPAMVRNFPAPVTWPGTPTGLLPEYRFVDPELSLLRVDLKDPVTGGYRPAGAFSIFAMHGTGNGSSNTLLDPDIQGIVARRLERHIDRELNQDRGPRFAPRAVYLFANSNEGDVSPAWLPQSRCDVPDLTPLSFLDGPFSEPLWQWRPPSVEHLADCQSTARRIVVAIGDSLGVIATQLFDDLALRLGDRFEIARAFVTIPLQEGADTLGICAEPAVGMQALVGADDAHTRMNHFSLFGLIPVGLEQGTTNRRLPGCHKQKHRLLDVLAGGALNTAMVAPQLPAFAQVTLLRLGDRLIGTVPAEATTTTGRRIRREIEDSARAHRLSTGPALLLGLTNGYMEYVTTAEEYTAQYYEGGSTLYGPGEAAMFGRVLSGLVSKLSSDNRVPPEALRFRANPGKPEHVIKQPKPGALRDGTIDSVFCQGDTLYARFELGAVHDWPSSTGAPSAGPRIAVENAAGAVVAAEDDVDVELYLRSFRKNPARWELRWSGPKRGTSYRVVVPGWVTSPPVSCAFTPTKRR